MASGGMCAERSGFLFSHECGRMANCRCAACGKSICEEHMRPSETGEHCVSCAKKENRRNERAGRQSSRYEDDPYFYGRRHYRGYGYYGHGYWGHGYYHNNYHNRHHHGSGDFTDADGESTRAEGNEGFEEDMGAS